MAGYTRQSVADIVNGSNITAPPLNAEFNQLATAFDPSTGHSHDGSSGNSPKIDLTTSITGYLPAIHGGIGGKNNTTATANPTTTDDFNSGYAPGSVWLNASTGRAFFCITNTVNNAVWTEVVGISPNNRITPEFNSTVDIGSSVYQFKDIYIDGTGYIDAVSGDTITLTSNATIGGNITLTGNLVGSGNITNTGTGYFGGNLTANADLAVTGTLNASGDVNLGNATTDTVTFISRVDSSIIPSADDTYNLGSTTNEWQNLYIDGTAEIDQLNADSVDIDNGNIDNTVIGAGTRAAGSFTGLTADGVVTFAGATVANLGNVTTADINGGTIDGVTIGTNSVVTDLRVDNLKVDGNAITSTNTNGNIDITPNGTGEVNISKVDIDSGTIDNTVIGATTPVAGSFTTVTTSGQATLATVDINGGAIDGTAIGGTTTSSGAFTTVSASGGFTGDLTGNVTGNLTGNITGNISGDVTGDLTGNVTASTGTSTFNNVTINGTLDVTSTVISNVSTPVANGDAANKAYVDTQIDNVIGGAPGALDTLNELAAALNDDANAYSTLDNKINTKLTKAGDTMTGALAMSTNKITGLGDPTANQDAATKSYVDTQRDTRLATAGGTMSGVINMGSNKVTNVTDPTNAQDAATKNYIDTTFGSTSAAATSAANAATSETNAANSATAAATSATNAATSEANAAASYDDFDDRYLGAKSSAPTVDNDGDALVIGALYFNTTSDTMQVYGSSGWVPAGSSVNGTSERFSYTATSAQTTFSGADNNGNTLAYDSGFLDVYLNGIRLVNGSDFTATTGTSIQLSAGANVSDTLEVVAYGTFTLSNQSIDDMTDVSISSPANGQVLQYNGTAWVNGSSPFNVVDDTTPQLGGNLDLNGNDITGTGNINNTGTITTDGLTVDGTTVVNGSNINIDNGYGYTWGTNAVQIYSNGSYMRFRTGGVDRMEIDGNANFVLNETGINADFRVESNNQSHMLFVDGGTDKITIGADNSNQRGTLTITDNKTITSSNFRDFPILALENDTNLEDCVQTFIGNYSGSNRYGNIIFSPDVNQDNSYFNIGGPIQQASSARFYGNGNIVFNESGEAYDFRVESNNTASMLHVKGSDEAVGIGTSNTNATLAVMKTNASNPTIRVYGDNSAGDDAVIRYQAQDTGGTNRYCDMVFDGDIDSTGGLKILTDYGYDSEDENIRFSNSGTVVNEGGGDQDFRVESNSNTHALFVDGGNDQVVIGSSVGTGVSGLSNGYLVINQGNTNRNGIVIYNQGEGYTAYTAKASNNTGNRYFGYWVNASGNNVGGIKYTSTGSTFLTTSDSRLKDNIENITNGTDKLMAMNPVTHTWKADPESPAVHGFIAQEMQDIVPEAVSGDPEGEEMMSMDYGRITPVLVAALQDAHKKIEALEARINEMEAK
jgi:hypothetical protein